MSTRRSPLPQGPSVQQLATYQLSHDASPCGCASRATKPCNSVRTMLLATAPRPSPGAALDTVTASWAIGASKTAVRCTLVCENVQASPICLSLRASGQAAGASLARTIAAATTIWSLAKERGASGPTSSGHRRPGRDRHPHDRVGSLRCDVRGNRVTLNVPFVKGCTQSADGRSVTWAWAVPKSRAWRGR
jgi:hypothetical protein